MSRMPGRDISYADACLERWARWGRAATASMGWPPLTLLARVIEQGFTGAAQVNPHEADVDDIILMTEGAVLALTVRERRVVLRFYMRWEPPQAAALSLGMDEGTFRRLLHVARRRVADYLRGAADLESRTGGRLPR